MTSVFDPVAIARELRTAERTVTPVPLLSVRQPGLTWDEARAVARARDDLRRGDGDRQIGWKLGWTSAAMRRALGINRPNWGTTWESQRLAESVDVSRFLHAKVEPELVYLCGADITGPVSVDEVAAACGGWALGFEVVDPRWPSFDFDWLDNTADNSSGSGVRIGDFALLTSAPADVVVNFHAVEDGDEVHMQGEGRSAMDDPLAAVAWLATALAQEGEGLRAGHIVFTGGLTAPVDLEAGMLLELRSGDLPPVNLRT